MDDYGRGLGNRMKYGILLIMALLGACTNNYKPKTIEVDVSKSAGLYVEDCC